MHSQNHIKFEMFENRLRVFDKRVLRGMFEPSGQEAAGKLVQLYSERLSVCSLH